MEKDKKFGVPWLRKRVPVGTCVKDVSMLKELGVSGTYIDKFRNSTYLVINFNYLINLLKKMIATEIKIINHQGKKY